MSWRIPWSAITNVFLVIRLIRPFESEQHIRSLMLRDFAATIAALRARASATRAEATVAQDIEIRRRVAPAESEHIHPHPPA